MFFRFTKESEGFALLYWKNNLAAGLSGKAES